MKFGGAALADDKRIRHVANIIKDFSQKNEVIVVVSAMQGVTDMLIHFFQKYKQQKFNEGLEILELLYNMHIKVEGANDILLALFGDLSFYFALNKQYLAKDYDYVISFGERLSSALVTKALNDLNLKAQVISSENIIVTDNNFGNANIFLGNCERKIKHIVLPILCNSVIPIVPGFFGGTKDGHIATLGRGGSDLSATILAYGLNADAVILWKEVDGVYDLDPKKNTKAVFFPKLSYRKALLLAKNGAKILHPQAMMPVQEKNIPVFVKNFYHPENNGTKICNWG